MLEAVDHILRDTSLVESREIKAYTTLYQLTNCILILIPPKKLRV